ncbi:MAG: hypothetical protein ACXIUZ_02360 [Lysobacteraceae bacterium]
MSLPPARSGESRPGHGGIRWLLLSAVFAAGLGALAPDTAAQSITRGSLETPDRIRWDHARYALPEHTVCFRLPSQRGMQRVLDGQANPRLRRRLHDFRLYARYDPVVGPVWRAPGGRFTVQLAVQVLDGEPGLDELPPAGLLERWLDEMLSELSPESAAESRARYSTAEHRSPDGRAWSVYENPYSGALVVSYQTALDGSDALELSFGFDKDRAERDPDWLLRRRQLARAIVDSVVVHRRHGVDCPGP